jgi:hypothetical protein
MGIHEMAVHMAEHNTPFSEGTIEGILRDFVKCVREQTLNGNTVKVDNSLERLPSGLTVGNMLGRLLIKQDFDYDQIYVIPIEVANSHGRTDILYLRALFALKQRRVSLAICDHYDTPTVIIDKG